ncbi:hypothetical protein [Streptomyces fuscichromogenes]|uniref:Secreted protein n=1 Tax=Streptomyces fuscichromogenes TaxID=1324013 RepID=A0A917XI64_9ACTN|nr:hypothetical protein [Streptomyces fuscichromogenes]GGN29249.1 hypothetical protein GCM10011578_065730 [Streptomyces fuscichromogenes]
MSLRSRTAGAALALAVPFALAAVPADATPVLDPDPFVWTDLTQTYTATADYQYEPFAVTDGYARTDTCDEDALGGKGGAGYHYVKAAGLGSLDPAEPAGLLYETDAGGGRALVAVEWIVPAGGDGTAPTLFGQRFQGPTTVPGVTGAVYTLRAWIWKDSPSGLFAPWNPTVTCP